MELKRKIVLMLLSLVIGIVTMNGQVLRIEGIVLDVQGEPIIGASVIVKESTPMIGSITDMNGKFVLNSVPKSAKTLVASYVGMQTQEVKISQNVKIVLEEEQQMIDEVIVVAYGEQKRSSFTGSATIMNKEKIEQKQVTNVTQALIGEVAGLEMAPTTSPGSTQDITIRGEGSINAGTAPLIIVDGMPYEVGLNNINPSDVENITVLKDAASNALYGARGANGVIMITTKRGKTGKAVVTVDAKWGINQRASRDYDKITNPGQYYEMHYKALYNSYVSGGMTQEDAFRKANETLCGSADNGGLVYNVFKVPENEYLIGKNGKLNPHATLGNQISYLGNSYTLMPDNWTKEAYKSGLRQEYNININGGNEKSQIYGAFGYLNDKGIVEASGYERYTGRLKANYQVKDWLKFGGNVSYVHSVTNNVSNNSTYTEGSVFTDAANIAPIYPMYVRDGNGNIMSNEHGVMYDYGENDNFGLTRPSVIGSNSLKDLELNKNEDSNNSFNGNAFTDFSYKDFSLSIKMGTSLWEGRQTTTYNPYYGYNKSSGGSLYKSHYRYTTLNLQQVLNWAHCYNDVHNVSATLGHESYKYKEEYLSASKMGAVDYENNQELYGWLTTLSAPYSYTNDYNTEGFFGRVMYNYDNRWFGSASYRRDASSRFHPDNRWGNFWSLGGAWIISKEKWFKARAFNSLKIKASYGQQGNDQIGNYRYTDLYDISTVDNMLSLYFNAKGNKDITWESNANFNAGFEFEMFKNRLSGSIEYYNRTTSDMLMWFSVPSTLGYSGYYKNVGDLRNQGFELTFNGILYKNKKVEWSTNLNLTYNSNKVTSLADANKSQNAVSYKDGKTYQGFQSGNYFIGEGLPLESWYMPKYAGVDEEGRSLWYIKDNEGNLTTTNVRSNATYFIIENQRPVYGGLSTSARIYGFDLSAQFTYSIGGKGYDWEYYQLMSNPTQGRIGYTYHKDLLNAWTSENTTSDIPRFQYNDSNTNSMSDRFLISNSYFCFQNFQIGYTLPSGFVQNLGMEKVRFYITGENLALWSKRKGYDPRLNSGYGAYSPMRTISGGFNIQF